MLERSRHRAAAVFGFLIFLALIFTTLPALAQSGREHLVYFRDTQHELNVYKIHGRMDGPTMMIIGGIQGDEPGGFLSADLYADLALKRGNLIVVPRANFLSILLYQRGPNGDMNRKFGDEVKKNGDRDSEIVRIIESLMAETDVMLNLHDGWGFYRPVWEDKLANPMRYGQSIISDAAEFVSPRNGRKLELGKMAEQVIAEVNAQIDNPRHHFHYMNTRTNEKNSPYREQQTSATYYALTRHGIPAFGVETSKNLPSIEMKVHQHNLAVNAFMKIFGLEPEQPRIYLVPPELKYIIVSVNGQVPVAVADGDTLYVDSGDTVEVIHLEANYDRGLSVDIQGLGTINDFRQPFKVTKPLFIVAQKDHMKFGRVKVALRPSGPESPGQQPRIAAPFKVLYFIVEVEGVRHIVADGEQLDAIRGDRIRLVDVLTQGDAPRDLCVNFKGFVGDQHGNTGEDRGHVINTAEDLMDRYSLSDTDKVYAVVAEQGNRVIARMTLRLNQPRLDYLVVQRNEGPRLCLRKGESMAVSPGDTIRVLDLKTNVPENRGVAVDIQGRTARENEPETLLSFKAVNGRKLTLEITRAGLSLGQVTINAG